MSKPKEPSAAAVKAHPAPVREDFKTGAAYAKACQKTNKARLEHDAKKPKPKARVAVKPGTGRESARARKQMFAYVYIANGRNGTAAAKEAGYSPKTAYSIANQLLKDLEVQKIIAEATEKAAAVAGLSVERTLLEVARLAYSDVRKLLDPDGNLKPINTLDDDAAAAISSIEVDETKVDGKVLIRTKKVKQYDKGSALTNAMRYHGLFEKDNKQIKGDSLPLTVVFGKE